MSVSLVRVDDRLIHGQVVHASTYKTGVKVSPWNYRAPIRVVNVLGD